MKYSITFSVKVLKGLINGWVFVFSSSETPYFHPLLVWKKIYILKWEQDRRINANLQVYFLVLNCWSTLIAALCQKFVVNKMHAPEQKRTFFCTDPHNSRIVISIYLFSATAMMRSGVTTTSRGQNGSPCSGNVYIPIEEKVEDAALTMWSDRGYLLE